MADYSPTIISASLSDDDLKNSIAALVKHVEDGAKQMSTAMTNAVAEMKKQLQSLGDIKVDTNSVSDGGSTRRTKKQNEETQAVKETTIAYDQLAQATGKATGRMTIMETYDMQIKLLIERLKEVRADIDIFNSAIGSGKATQVEWGQRGLKEANAEAERLMRIISNLESKRDALNSIMQPQGHTIQNYVQSLQKVNPELALLNQQYKNGTALLQQKNLVLRRSAQEEQQAAEASANALQKQAAYISQASQREAERRRQIEQTGIAAQESAQRVIASINEQMNSGTGIQVPTKQIYELLDLFKQMNTAYFEEGVDKESPLYKSIMRDMEAIRVAIKEVTKYNNAIFRETVNGGGGITQRSTLESLRKEIKALTDEYNKMSIAQINAGKADALIKNFQNATRAAEILQKTLSRPLTLQSALGLKENTLDEIAYKMRMLEAYRSNLNIYDPTQAKEIETVNKALLDLSKTQQQIVGNNKSIIDSNTALSRSWNYMKNRLAFYFTVGASTAFVKNLIEVRSQYEMNERALGILINSAERGTQIFKELSEMALVSPYTLIELSSATKQLVAYGVAAKDAVDTTRRLADMAAAVGIPMERLTYALGQIKAYGYLNSRDQRMFANAGIPLVQELAKHYTELEGKLVSTADVYDRIKKRAVDYTDVLQVINKMTDEGGKFYDYQAKMAETLKVQFANLTLAWNNMLNEIGADSQGIISSGIKGLKQLFLHWRTLDEAIKNFAWTVGVLKAFQFSVLLLAGALKTAEGWTLLLGKRITELGIAFGKASLALATNPTTWVVTAVFALASLIRHTKQVAEAAREMNRELAKNAKEASDSLEKYLGSESSKESRVAAKSGKLSATESKKAFEDLRAQIELSSDNANSLMAHLLKIEDVNERLTAAFNLADKIQEATSKLSGLREEALEVEQDSWLWGAFWDGLATDLNDYIKWVKSDASENRTTESRELKGARAEAEREMNKLATNVAEVIRERLGESINDPVMLEEAIERFRKIIKEKNPTIKGEVAQWFDIKFDELISAQFGGALDVNTSLNRQFLTILKRDYASAFASITDDIIKDNARWSKSQEEAIKKAAEELKKTTLPAWHSTIDDMVAYMNSKDWRIRIATEMDVSQRTELQREWDERLKVLRAEEKARLNPYRPKSGDSLSKWAEEQRKQIQELDKDIQSYEADNSKFSKTQIENIEKEKKARQDALKVFNQPTATKDDLKNQKKAESELQKALKDELSLIDKVRSSYKQLTKEGVSATEALATATSGYDETVNSINNVLKRFGIATLDLTKYAGVANPKAILDMLQAQLDALMGSGLAKPAEIKDLQVKLQDLQVESITFNQQTLTNSLNNELGKLKDEYELAIDMDATPELADAFVDMMGLNKEELASLPKDFEGVVRKMQSIIDDKLGEGRFNVEENLNKKTFERWVEASGMQLDSTEAKGLKAFVDYANKIRQDETKKQIEDWDKLLEKYAEYEYKRKQITEEYEREISLAIKKNASQDILDAIENRRDREYAKLDFEEFQKSATWITATGDLATLTDKALGVLIDGIEEYKATAKNLSPKEIKQINNALKQLRSEQRKGNPLLSVSTAFEAARSAAQPFVEEVRELEEEYDQLRTKVSRGDEGLVSKKDLERLEELPELIDKAKKKANEMGKVVATQIVEGINSIVGVASQATSAITDMMRAFGDEESAEALGNVMSALEKGGQFAAVGASIGGGWGAAIGGIIGFASSLFTSMADIWSGNRSITKQIEASEKSVKRLELAYKSLERAVSDAYGTGRYEAQMLVDANKRAQLAELQRQLELEKSRKQKYRDTDKIVELESQILDLQYEIEDNMRDIVNDFMGISSVGDAVEDIMNGIVDALRNGEDAMASFDESIDEMIVNMIKKLYSEKVIGSYLEDIWDDFYANIEGRGTGTREQIAAVERAKARMEELYDAGLDDVDNARKYLKWADYIAQMAGFNNIEDIYNQGYGVSTMGKFIDDYILNGLKNRLREETSMTTNDIDELISMFDGDFRTMLEGNIDSLREMLEKYGLMKDESEQKLSALQQGIQGITEDTAGAIEAYLNGVSQQVYLHSQLLTEIRDLVAGMNSDVSLGVQSQMLLQLQNSYQTQQAIQGILQGALSPSGRAFMVEMN